MVEEEEIDEIWEASEEDDLSASWRFVIDKGQQPLRVDKFLFNRLEKVSRNKIQQAAEADAIRVNDQPVKSNYKVKPGDILTLVLHRASTTYPLLPEPIPLHIVYEDDSLLVLNKQAGLVVHPGSGNYTGTLVNGLLYHFGQLPGSEARPGLIHRIDKNTTGLMVIAKTEPAMVHLARQFFDHTIDRKYVALVWGDMAEDAGTIEGNIGRHLRFRKKMDVFPDGEQGKTAITHYRVLERLGYVNLVECRLETGRTHQIRVHFQHIGHPLFNDDTYDGNRIVKGTMYTKYKQFVENCFAILPRHALHAQELGFEHPETKERMIFESPLPNDMVEVLGKWRNYFKAMT